MILSPGTRPDLNTKNLSDVAAPEKLAAPIVCLELSNLQKSILTPEKIKFFNLPVVHSCRVGSRESRVESGSSPFEWSRGKSDLKVGDYCAKRLLRPCEPQSTTCPASVRVRPKSYQCPRELFIGILDALGRWQFEKISDGPKR